MKIGFTCSCWDLLHAGHLLFLKEAKEHCDFLIVGIQSDPSIDRPHKKKPVETLEERILRVDSLKYVNKYFIYETEKDLYEYLKTHEQNIDIRFLGSDYLDKSFTGDDLNIHIFYHHRNHEFSSTNLYQRIIKHYENDKSNIVRDVINVSGL
jgi:glycerol-3-phosphate cytidylyltransferase